MLKCNFATVKRCDCQGRLEGNLVGESTVFLKKVIKKFLQGKMESELFFRNICLPRPSAPMAIVTSQNFEGGRDQMDVIVISKLLKRHLKAKRRAPAYS